MSEYQKEINALNDTMAAISVKINKVTATDDNNNKLFSDEDLQELNDMIEVETYTDSYYTTSYGLYNYAVKYNVLVGQMNIITKEYTSLQSRLKTKYEKVIKQNL